MPFLICVLCCLDLREANQSVRDHLNKQNLKAMEVIKSTFNHVVEKKVSKSLDEYLNALFSCLAAPYRGVQTEDVTALELLEILSSLHEVNRCSISLNSYLKSLFPSEIRRFAWFDPFQCKERGC